MRGPQPPKSVFHAGPLIPLEMPAEEAKDNRTGGFYLMFYCTCWLNVISNYNYYKF